jgi:hypothetical protein
MTASDTISEQILNAASGFTPRPGWGQPHGSRRHHRVSDLDVSSVGVVFSEKLSGSVRVRVGLERS